MSTNPNDDESDDGPSERPRTDLDVLRDLFGDWFGIASPPRRPGKPDKSEEPDDENSEDDGPDDTDTETDVIGSAATGVDIDAGIPLFDGSEVYQHQSRLVEVVDGDTLTVDVDLGFRTTSQWRLRLAGVDTGEIYGTEKESEEYQRGKDHEAFAAQWLDDARTQYDGEWPLIVLSVEKGKYGRFITAIRRKSDDAILNDDLINEFGLEVVSDQ
jgi:endonuclease YncB( thermonuclease family)